MNTEFCEKEQSSCSIDTSVSTSIEIVNIEFCEREQSFCSIDFFVSASIASVVSEHSDFYERKQFCSSADTVDIVEIICFAVVVVNTDALTLTADMIKKKKKSS